MISMDESLRLKDLARYKFSYDTPDDSFNELAEIAKHVLKVPISGISIVDEHNVWLKARLGVDITCLEREGAFCSYAVEGSGDNYIVEDTLLDPLFKENDLVVNHGIRFYASAVLRNKEGFNIGTLWVMDSQPRTLDSKEKTILNSLASQSIRLLESRYLNLTSGLPNKITFIEQLQTLIDDSHISTVVDKSAAKQTPEIIVGAIYIRNLDALEDIAGSLGLSNIQQEIAARLAKQSLTNYHFAHLNNDLFAFAISENNETSYQKDIDLLQNVLSQPITINDYQTNVLVAIGLVESPLNGVNASSLVTQAIAVAKDLRNSKKEIVINKCALISHADYIKVLYKDLHCPIKASGLHPFYQPQVDVSDSTIVGFEALARWQNEQVGNVSPLDFVPIAENSGLIVDLDLYILQQVFDDLNAWHKSELQLMPVAVNLSRLSLVSANFIEKVTAIINPAAFLTQFIKIEITESFMFDEQDPSGERIQALRALGFKIAIDDFGTGFSNLSTLRLLHFDQLKVDRQFIHGISHSSHISELFLFIKNVAFLFEANLMCEGMENEEDIEVLIKHGAHFMQGWYFSKAIPASSVPQLLSFNQKIKQQAEPIGYQQLALQIHNIVDSAVIH